MTKTKEMESLESMGEPEKVEIVSGLVFETKLRIKTQRKLERHFELPITRIFPGMDPKTKEAWDGVDFNFLDNAIPLMTILAQQVDESITEDKVEEIFENMDEKVVYKKLEKYFKTLVERAKPKNQKKPNRKK